MKNLINKNKIILIIALIIIAIILCSLPKGNYNSKYKLEIINVYGDTQAFHPKVITFENVWNGYKYWMAYTPYPNSDAAKENPHIAASNDLINWDNSPNGLCNPLDEVQDDYNTYNSDTHLVYNNDLDRIECYWRYVNDLEDKAIIYRIYSYDGKNWSEKDESLILNSRTKEDCLSPAIIYENNLYKMWYVGKEYKVIYLESEDGLNWKNKDYLDIQYEEKLKTWHLDVIKTKKGYEMLIVAFKQSSTDHNTMNLYYSYSSNGKEWGMATKILSPSTGSRYWDNLGIYRSSFIYENGMYFVFYSGTNLYNEHGIGLVCGKDILNLNKININYKKGDAVKKFRELIKF